MSRGASWRKEKKSTMTCTFYACVALTPPLHCFCRYTPKLLYSCEPALTPALARFVLAASPSAESYIYLHPCSCQFLFIFPRRSRFSGFDNTEQQNILLDHTLLYDRHSKVFNRSNKIKCKSADINPKLSHFRENVFVSLTF